MATDDQRYQLTLDRPAAGFTDSFLLGNGHFGASVRGGIGEEYIDLNLDTLWSGGPSLGDGGVSPATLLPALRAAIEDQDFAEADRLSTLMQGKGWTQSYQPLGAIKLRYASGSATNYHRCLDLAWAESRTQYDSPRGPVAMRSLVSQPDDVLLVDLWGQGLSSFDDLALDFASPHPANITGQHRDGQKWLTITGRVPAQVLPNYVEIEPAIVYATDQPDADGLVDAGMGFAVVAVLQQTETGARLFVAAESGFRGYDQRPSADTERLARKAQARLGLVSGRESDAIAATHRADYAGYFDRADLDLSASPQGPDADPARAELLFHFGRYLMISSSRPGTQAANLQGLWNIDVRPAWSCNYTVNINTEMNYWPAHAVGLSDLAEPFHRFISEAAGVSGQHAARHYYGAGGAALHHNTDIWHFSAPVNGDPFWANWPSGLLWMATQLHRHIDAHPEDTGFVESVALPVWRQAISFAETMLVETADGLVTSPSSSPENRFVTSSRQLASITRGATLDQELLYDLLGHYLDHEHDPALRDKAATMLARLRLPTVAADGTLEEWAGGYTPGELGHRHFSHLYGLYPGNRINRLDTPEEFAAARASLCDRLSPGSGHTGWSQAWVLCLAARLGDIELADRAINGLLRDLTFASLLVLHPHHQWAEGKVFQIDGNFGAVAGMSELLVQSTPGRISMLPALPPSWPSGTVRGIRTAGGHILSMRWVESILVNVTLQAGSDGVLTLEVPSTASLKLPTETIGSGPSERHTAELPVSKNTTDSFRVCLDLLSPTDQALSQIRG